MPIFPETFPRPLSSPQTPPFQAVFKHVPVWGQFRRRNDTTDYVKLSKGTYSKFSDARWTRHGYRVQVGAILTIANKSELVYPVGRDIEQNPFD
jgi:hypothetical protein